MTLLEVPMRNRMGYTQHKVWAMSRLFAGVHQRILLLSSSVTWPWDPLAKTEIWSQRVTLESLCWCQLQLGSHRRSLHCSCCHPGRVRTDWKQSGTRAWETRTGSGKRPKQPKPSQSHSKHTGPSLKEQQALWAEIQLQLHTQSLPDSHGTLCPFPPLLTQEWGTDQKFQNNPQPALLHPQSPGPA